MINENNFKQIEHLIFEMTTPFTQDERIELGCLCGRMAKDINFEQQYTGLIKELYVRNYRAIKNNSYQKVSFSDINKQTLDTIEQGKKAQPTIDPTLNKTSTNPDQTLAKIKSLKETIFSK